MNTFLPQGYKTPSHGGQFMKLDKGNNKVRILSDAIVGWEGWKDNKPFRRQGMEQNITKEEVDWDFKYDRPKINHFWAVVVWNYAEEKIQVLTITQRSIQQKIENYYMSDDWGTPVNRYDLDIKRIEDGGKISYDVIASPHKPTSIAINEALESSKIDLHKIFDGEYPMDIDEPAQDTSIPF